ncbi:RagB/SusD family nutrient uptake outer membrane protein [Pedobacter sp. PAMC26386]|nr:RagB/SusD family nutrient uptake outer membrane protein [Pedobacter sp. PAMC26386]
MKNKFILLLMITGVIIGVVSCKKGSLLDKKTETLTEERVFADSTLTYSFINDMYAYTGQDILPQRSNIITSPGSNDYACLDDQTSLSVSFYTNPQGGIMQGSVGAGGYALNNYWTTFYTKIRAANLLMQKLPVTPLSPAKRKRLAGEARFLRAFFYASLVRFYGGVQLMGDEVLDINDALTSKRNAYKECIDYIAKELDAAALDLPLTQDPSEYGRATKGACLALKARMLVTAASPLYNGKSISTDPSVLPLISYSTSYDASLWQKAADACKAVIGMGGYSLVEDNVTRPGNGFWKMFIKGRVNTEYIFPYMITNGTSLESLRFPRSRSGSGWSNPTENAVQYFGMRNGKLISDQSSSYDAKNPYANRDPRFYYSIIYNQAPIYKAGSGTTLVPVDIYFNAATNSLSVDGLANSYTKTGYYSRKMANDSTGTSSSINRVYPVIRFAEIILGYAEALNESGNTEQAVTVINQIRRRAGIEAGSDSRYGVPFGISQVELRKLIQNEYTVEFFQEGHFRYDTRRWRTAEITENKPMLGMYITKETNNSYTYKTITALSVNWQDRSYFAPIPQNEINKAITLIQNPGW